MNQEFQEAVRALVEKHKGNLSEAARAAGLAVSLLSDTLNGSGPADPRTTTWNKVNRALGKPLLAVHERSAHYGSDKAQHLADWLREHDDAWPFVLNAAKGSGYVEPPQQGKASRYQVRSGRAVVVTSIVESEPNAPGRKVPM